VQLESFKSFDFDEWRQRYMAWIRDKKFRITDFFRRQDKRGEGMLIREQFVEGMMASSMYDSTTLYYFLDIAQPPLQILPPTLPFPLLFQTFGSVTVYGLGCQYSSLTMLLTESASANSQLQCNYFGVHSFGKNGACMRLEFILQDTSRAILFCYFRQLKISVSLSHNTYV